jgi:hypothetical protein
LAFLAGLFWLPESPRWLILQGKKTEGLAILHKIGGEDFALNTLNQVETSVKKQQRKFRFLPHNIFHFYLWASD